MGLYLLLYLKVRKESPFPQMGKMTGKGAHSLGSLGPRLGLVWSLSGGLSLCPPSEEAGGALVGDAEEQLLGLRPKLGLKIKWRAESEEGSHGSQSRCSASRSERLS